MKAKIVIEVADNTIGCVTSTIPLEDIIVINGDYEDTEGEDKQSITIGKETSDYYVYKPSYECSVDKVRSIIEQVHKGTPKLTKVEPVEVYLIVTDVHFDKRTCLYGDILAVFWDLEEAEKVAEKVKKGEPVDFIDADGLFEYDDIAVIPFTIR